MNKDSLESKIFLFICVAFSVAIVIANIISAKVICCTEQILFPAGLLIFPITFIMTDFVTEIYGQDKAKTMVYIAFTMAAISYGVFKVASILPGYDPGISDAFDMLLGYHGSLVFASLAAYLVSQVIDIRIYAFIKKVTGGRFLWLRNNVSTICSQLIDTIVMCSILYYWTMGMDVSKVFELGLYYFSYKALMSVLLTPIFYLAVFCYSNRVSKVHP